MTIFSLHDKAAVKESLPARVADVPVAVSVDVAAQRLDHSNIVNDETLAVL